MGNSFYRNYKNDVMNLIVVYNSIYEEKGELDKELKKQNLSEDKKQKISTF